MGLSQGPSLHATYSRYTHACTIRFIVGAIYLQCCETSRTYTMANTSVGGYDLNWLEEPPDDLKCLICLEVAKDPYQHGGSLCGKVFCNGCITEYQKHKTTCPNCRKDLSLFQDARSKCKTRNKNKNVQHNYIIIIDNLTFYTYPCRHTSY